MQQPLPTVLRAGQLNEKTAIDQFAQGWTKTLLGDPQNFEQLRHRKPWLPVDEMQHAVMRSPKPVFGQHLVSIRDEITVGEEEQLDHPQIDAIAELQRRHHGAVIGGLGRLLGRGKISHCFSPFKKYVRKVDIFFPPFIVPLRSWPRAPLPASWKENKMAGVPFDQLDGVIWYNGEFVKWGDAKVHVLTHGLHYASSVFEGERAYGGEIFELTKHSQRLHDSATMMGFEIPYSVEEIDEACRETLKRQGLTNAYVRPIAWRGSEMMGVSAQHNKINTAIAVWDWPSYFDPETKMKGIRLDIADWKRPDPATIPCKAKAAGLYMICTLSKHAAEAKGYADALMFDYRGQVAEATGANVFFTTGNEIHTPTPDCFLDGITRQTVIRLAKQRQFKVVERAIMPDEMASFEECFITGSAAEVTPVSEIGPYNFAPGPICKQMVDDYTTQVTPN